MADPAFDLMDATSDTVTLVLNRGNESNSGFAHYISITRDSPGSGDEVPHEELLQRLACVWMVDAIPSAGLHEVVETLSSLFQFYASRQSCSEVAHLPEGHTEAIASSLLPVESRPDFEFDTIEE